VLHRVKLSRGLKKGTLSQTSERFLPRNAMQRGLCCRTMSVCPSVTCRYSVETVTSSNFFHPRTQSKFFYTKLYGNIPTGTPLTGALNAKGSKNHDCRPISHFISEMIHDIAIRKANRKPYPSFRMVSVSTISLT